jgi:putrescine transport system permease protein
MMKNRNFNIFNSRFIIIFLPYLWVVIFFLLPFLMIIALSFSETIDAVPPYKFLFEIKNGRLHFMPSFTNFRFILQEKLYLFAYIESLKIAFYSTVMTLLIGYPLAYGITQSDKKWQALLLVLVLIPFFTSSLIRVYCWLTILKTEGIINNVLIWLGIVSTPLDMLNSKFAVIIGITYSYLPFMVLPIYFALEKINPYVIEAAADLGARPFAIFKDIICPLSLNGIIAGCLMVFIPAIGEFVIPDILGGSSVVTIGKVIWNEFFLNRDWPMASTLAVSITLIVVIPIIFLQKKVGENNE